MDDDIIWPIDSSDWLSEGESRATSYRLDGVISTDPNLTENGAWTVRVIKWLVPSSVKDFRMVFIIDGDATGLPNTANAAVFLDVEREAMPGVFVRNKLKSFHDRDFSNGPDGGYHFPFDQASNNNFYNGRRLVYFSRESNSGAVVNYCHHFIEVFTN